MDGKVRHVDEMNQGVFCRKEQKKFLIEKVCCNFFDV